MYMLSQTARVNTSKWTGNPIYEELNTCYGYWATSRRLTEKEYKEYLKLPEYRGSIHKAEARHIESLMNSNGS